MNDQQVQEIVDRAIGALENLAPDDPGWWAPWAALTPFAALLVAAVAAWVGYKNLKTQQRALATQVLTHESTLNQKSEADARSEWWRRTQWALEAAASENVAMYDYGVGMLVLLAKSDLAGLDDKALLDAVWEGSATGLQDNGIKKLIQVNKDQGKNASGKRKADDSLHREILAARLKVTLDEELDRDTSTTVKGLSEMELPPIFGSVRRGFEDGDDFEEWHSPPPPMF